MTMTHPNSGRLNPDAPHAYQPRKVTWKGQRFQSAWMKRKGAGFEYHIPLGGGINAVFYEDVMPCRHCGGSPSLPVHL